MTIMGNELFQGNLVYLSAFQKDDIPQLTGWFKDIEFLYLMMGQHIMPAHDEKFATLIENFAKNGDLEFAVRTQDGHQLIGGVFLKDVDGRNRSAELVVYIGEREYWGRGYGSDGIQILLRYGFQEINLNRIMLRVFDYNARAMRAYQKIGFQHEGTKRESLYRDGRYWDSHVMSLLRSEWDNLTEK